MVQPVCREHQCRKMYSGQMQQLMNNHTQCSLAAYLHTAYLLLLMHELSLMAVIHEINHPVFGYADR